MGRGSGLIAQSRGGPPTRATRQSKAFIMTSPNVVTVRLLASCIEAYQRHRSPSKGLACAHRIRRGGGSCFEFVWLRLLRHGLMVTVMTVWGRAKTYAAAAFTLRSAGIVMNKSDHEGEVQRDCAIVFCCVDGGVTCCMLPSVF
jgi:hypothetical protein